ncbi:MAG: Abortive infection protein [Myxococcales bacterium]|jgi:membrane protease YdiL (CAAX protease family)|nr:Abortive infection protein [Myxococcales bacterium]
MVMYLALGAAAVTWGTLRGQANIWRLPGRTEPLVFASLASGLALGLAIVFWSRMALYRFEWARALHREFRGLLFPMTEVEILILALASSFGEELFFRGALLPAIGLVGSSLLFAVLHIGPKTRHLPWTFSSLGAGFLFGAIFLWTGDLAGPVLAHFLVNFLNLRHVAQYELR